MISEMSRMAEATHTSILLLIFPALCWLLCSTGEEVLPKAALSTVALAQAGEEVVAGAASSTSVAVANWTAEGVVPWAEAEAKVARLAAAKALELVSHSASVGYAAWEAEEGIAFAVVVMPFVEASGRRYDWKTSALV